MWSKTRWEFVGIQKQCFGKRFQENMATFRVIAWLPSTHILSWHEISRTVCFLCYQEGFGIFVGLPFFDQTMPCNLYPTSWHSCQVPWVRFHFLAVKMWLEPCWSIAMGFLTMRIWAWKMNWSLGFVKIKYLFDRIDGGIIYELLFKN